MSADVDSPSSPGLRALLGRLLHGLLPYRLFQLVGAAWSYLMRPWGLSWLSLLPSGWVVHRSVRPSELPEVLEALGLGPGAWDELGGCLEELGPWKELTTPAIEAELEILRSLKGFVSSSQQQDSWDCTLEELDCWQKAMVHSKMQNLWEPGLGSWEGFVDPNQEEDECHKNASANHSFSSNSYKLDAENGPCEAAHEKNVSQLPSSYYGMVSCILSTGSAGVFTWVDQGSEHNLQTKDVFDKISSPSEPEIEHIRNKRLWFLQQNQAQNAVTPDLEQEQDIREIEQNQKFVHMLPDTNQFVLPNQPSPSINLDMPVPEWHDGELQEMPHQSKLLTEFVLSQREVLELPGIDQECSPCDQLSVLVQKPGNIQSKYLPSPDQDQGYHSLEDWQCLNIAQYLKAGGIGTPEICEPDPHVVYNIPTELPCSDVTSLNDDQDSDDMNSDLEEDIPVPSVPICINKHIGYILGTILSSDEEDDVNSSSEDDDWDEDDGFDSEGSVSTTDSGSPVPEEAVLWNPLCTPDPYNPQNFTASLQTGTVAEENSHSVDGQEHILSDEESWCDSDAVSCSDSEDECSADEEGNLKLWNAFLKSDDPYNPMYFKASVQTSQKKKMISDTASKHSELACTNPTNCELTLISSCTGEPQILQFKKTHNVPIEESANRGHRKVTFHDKVTVYYVCNEEERKGHWEEFARDRCRFQRRIQETESTIGHCLNHDHRQRIWNRMQEKWGS
ncbi:protein phosphatase 1 regulatory subunit 15B [Mixophyes fleayi]|uniref:protein phosphatase 1 regulatory subunit 15B n=1 Tax=Mixophyes fleayi TaxID=3061075 RepID=UPI003F4D92F3